MGVQLIDEQTSDPELKSLVVRVHGFANKAGLEKMPEVGFMQFMQLFSTHPDLEERIARLREEKVIRPAT